MGEEVMKQQIKFSIDFSSDGGALNGQQGKKKSGQKVNTFLMAYWDYLNERGKKNEM